MDILGYLNWISFLGYDLQSYPNSKRISLNILEYPYISYHILSYPKISSGMNSQMLAERAAGVLWEAGPTHAHTRTCTHAHTHARTQYVYTHAHAHPSPISPETPCPAPLPRSFPLSGPLTLATRSPLPAAEPGDVQPLKRDCQSSKPDWKVGRIRMPKPFAARRNCHCCSRIETRESQSVWYIM
jgi:hypothetical protein